ncbi:BRO family protein [Iningainema tapete]|uniref:Bro-N domain-containing protein n=1 Tax=Iningainema tapete BLCC-T55 TaxID=2748662 RepID=A0A8J7C5U2_9CYAN|nr:BRO family protein [Iningainema tapete]MBD2771196.1 hypothetical protein [Iningainema tapete BLCC-T55]
MTTIAKFEGSSPFDQIRLVDQDGNEYWLARQLQLLLGYNQWRRFEETIERAKLACRNSGYTVENHFADVGNVVERPQGGGSKQSDYKLSRYACYLTAMNGDPRKHEIALAQSYFATKTRQTELELINQETLKSAITEAVERSLAPLLQRLEQMERSIPQAHPSPPRILSASTPPDEVPDDYQQLDDERWISPEYYERTRRQAERSLFWETRRANHGE